MKMPYKGNMMNADASSLVLYWFLPFRGVWHTNDFDVGSMIFEA